MNTCHGIVTRDVTGGVTVPRPDPTRPITTSGYASIQPQVVEAPPEAWMDLDDLNLLDDDTTHSACLTCYPPETWRLLDTYTAMCGRRVLAKSDTPLDWAPNTCAECDSAYFCPMRWSH